MSSKYDRSDAYVLYRALMDGKSRAVAATLADVPINCIYAVLEQHGFKLPKNRFSNKYLLDDEFVRKAHTAVKNGLKMAVLAESINSGRESITRAFHRLGLEVVSSRLGLRRTAAKQRLDQHIHQISAVLTTERQEVVAKKLDVSVEALNKALDKHGIKKADHRKQLKPWLSRIEPDTVRAAYDLVVGRKSSYSAEARKLKTAPGNLKKLCLRLGLDVPLLGKKKVGWMSRIPREEVIAAHERVVAKTSTTLGESKRLKTSQSNLLNLYRRLGLEHAFTLKGEPILAFSRQREIVQTAEKMLDLRLDVTPRTYRLEAPVTSRNEQLNDPDLVRAAHGAIESGEAVHDVLKLLGATRLQLIYAFARCGLSTIRDAVQAGKITYIDRHLAEIASSLRTENLIHVAKRFRVSLVLLRAVLKMRGIQIGYPDKGRKSCTGNLSTGLGVDKVPENGLTHDPVGS